MESLAIVYCEPRYKFVSSLPDDKAYIFKEYLHDKNIEADMKSIDGGYEFTAYMTANEFEAAFKFIFNI